MVGLGFSNPRGLWATAGGETKSPEKSQDTAEEVGEASSTSEKVGYDEGEAIQASVNSIFYL